MRPIQHIKHCNLPKCAFEAYMYKADIITVCMPGSMAMYLYACCAYTLSACVCMCGMYCMFVLYKYMHYLFYLVLCFSQNSSAGYY